MSKKMEKVISVTATAHVFTERKFLYFEAFFSLPVGFDGTDAEAMDLMIAHIQNKRDELGDHPTITLPKEPPDYRWEPWQKTFERRYQGFKVMRACDKDITFIRGVQSDYEPGCEIQGDDPGGRDQAEGG